ncbi:MAG: TolC family protein [Sterolibacterium sp.]|jgi:cobalt-zinc-cadmium efflux system outer membrane protein
MYRHVPNYQLTVARRAFAAAIVLTWVTGLANTPWATAAPTESTERPAPQPLTQSELGELTLRDALALALARNPELAAFSQELRATEGAVLQAGVLPNPILEIGRDNLSNVRKTEAGDRTTSLQLGQLIELGGKRAARVRLAETGRDLANWDYETKRIAILSQVAQRLVDVLASQSRKSLAEETVTLTQQVADAAAKRVLAGKVSPVEETKARLALASAEVEFEQAKRELISTRQALGALWGEPNPRFDKAIGDLAQTVTLPAYEKLAERVRNNPELARWSTELARRQAGVEAERAKAVPDITLSAGTTRFSQFDDRAYMVGISIPIPLFDRNRGGILEANRRLDKASDEQRAVETRLTTELGQSYQRLAAVDKEIQILRTTLLPGAQGAFDAAIQGYKLGKFGFLDVLDAQRTLFHARSQNLRALTDYQRGVIEIERLIGGPLNAPLAPSSQKVVQQ